VHWTYDKRGDPTIAPPDPSIPSIKITKSATGETIQIKQLDCSEPHKTLGVLISRSKNQAAEHTHALSQKGP
jgi:hypothetical protein